MRGTRLQEVVLDTVAETEPVTLPEPPPVQRQQRQEAVSANLLALALQKLSQRAIVAIASMVDLALIASVFVALLMILGTPSLQQMISVAGYAVFVSVAIVLRRR